MPPTLPVPSPRLREQIVRPQPKIHNPIKLTKEYMDNRAKLTRGEFEASQRGAVQARFGKIEEQITKLEEGLEGMYSTLQQILEATKKNKE